MKAVIILGALALVLVSGLEQNEEESQLSLSEGTLQREARDAEPRRRRKSQKKRSKKGKKNVGKRKGKKAGNKKRGGKNKQRNKKKVGSKRKGPRAGAGRQSTDCLADVVTAIKGYRSAGNQKRMAMRIATQFGDAFDTLGRSKLKNCYKTAAALRDDSTVNDR